jgi:RNA polymerase sigma factor (sigma-70 family)
MAEKEDSPLTDAVWRRLKTGDAQAVDILMRQYYSDLYQYGMKLSHNRSLTKDCIQDLFVKLWQDRGKLSEVSHVKTYLLISLKRNLIKKLVRENRFSGYEDEAEESLGIEFSAEDIFILRQELSEQKEMLIRALNQLPKRQREAIYLKFYEELSSEQIAEILTVKPQSVYNLVYDALKRLKEKLLQTEVLLLIFLSLLSI